MSFRINKLERDDFGRASGILAIDKPQNMTSHDVVNIARRELNMKKIGHAGALDPFATGVLVLLVGKATKLSDKFINSDKEYVAKVLFGVQTDSADVEGNILTQADPTNIDLTNLAATLQAFSPDYEQYVPVYSSVKVDGQKLRVLARSADKHWVEDRDDGKYVIFENNQGQKVVKLPTHQCHIPEIELLDTQTNLDITGLDFYQRNQELLTADTYPIADVRVACSKGTYIRTLAEDIGLALTPPCPAMLIELQRTRVDKIKLSHAIKLDQLSSL